MSKFYIGQRIVIPEIYEGKRYRRLKRLHTDEGYLVIESKRNCSQSQNKCNDCSGVTYKFFGHDDDSWCELGLIKCAVSKPLIVKPKQFKLSNNE